MSSGATVILQNGDLIREICGSNDSNLRYLEQLLNTRILLRGNELFLENGSPHTQELFLRLLGALEQRVERGQTPSPEIIRSLYSSLDAGDEPEELISNSIAIALSGTTIVPHNRAQAEYMHGMQRYPMVFGVGPAGTGKTYLAVAHALRLVLQKKRRRLILTRPVVEAGERLGFLPGDLTQKLQPYLQPLYDAMVLLATPEAIHAMEEQGRIEIAPLAYMRGRNLADCCVILDEAQNTTPEQMQMFLTRIGQDAQVIVNGDITQIDLPEGCRSGLVDALQVLDSVASIGIYYLTVRDVVRSPLVRYIVAAYERNRDKS